MKLIYLKNGTRELYDLKNDIGEKHNMLASHPQDAERLDRLMQRYISDGRSTPGEVQRNSFDIKLGQPQKAKRNKKKAS